MRSHEFEHEQDARVRPGMSQNLTRVPDVRPSPNALAMDSVLRLQRLAGNAATTGLLARRPRSAQAPDRPAGWTPSGPMVVSRLKEPASPFSGGAGTADARAGAAGGEAVGIAPIAVDRSYAASQVERKEAQMDAFRHADIPFVDDNMDHYGYKNLVKLRQEYVDDDSRLVLGEQAFNGFVGPGTLANKATAQFQAIQMELGYTDDMDPTEDLSDKQKKALAKNLDEKKINTLNESVANKEKTTQGLRKEILGTAHQVQSAVQRRLAVLGAEARQKGETEKKEIEDKIAAVKGYAETAATVVSTVSFAGFGGPAAIKEIAGGGAGIAKGGLELGEKGLGLIGGTVEFIMTEMYKEDIEKAKQAIEKAKAAEEHARKLDADLGEIGGKLQIEGQVDQLAGAMGELAAALRARKDYFAKLGSDTDKAASRGGNGVSQYLSYVSQAIECKSHLASGLSAAGSADSVLATQNSAIASHRRTYYIVDAEGVWGNRNQRDPDGPDLEMLQAARALIGTFTKAASAQLTVVESVMRSLPAPQ